MKPNIVINNCQVENSLKYTVITNFIIALRDK